MSNFVTVYDSRLQRSVTLNKAEVSRVECTPIGGPLEHNRPEVADIVMNDGQVIRTKQSYREVVAALGTSHLPDDVEVVHD